MRRIGNFIVFGILSFSCGSFLSPSSANDETVATTKTIAVEAVKENSIRRASARSVAKTLEISKKIDSFVEKQLLEKKLSPNAMASDEIFVRRIYLDVIGRIPTQKETVEFLRDPSKKKRQHLIDKLLDSEGFVSHQFNFIADLLRIKSRLRNIPGGPYVDFVKESIRENKPYDEFVRELLSSEGYYAERGNGALGYYLRDYGMPEDNMSNTVRVFLGTRLECAQCHDHPFDVWTQRDYFEMVAFTGGVLMRLTPPIEGANDLRQMTRKGEIDESTRRNLQNILRPLGYGVQGTGTGVARLPDDYQADNGKPDEIVTAKTMFEKKGLVIPELPKMNAKNKRRKKNNRGQVNGAKHVDSRLAYAEWMTAADNPRFTTVIANRMWKRAMGVGLIEPVDIITEETKASNPELMNFLSEQMVDMKFDLKQFLRTVYNSKTYQREACISDAEEPTEYTFRGPLLRRMSGEQIWDSLMTMTVDNIDNRTGGDNNRAYGMDVHTMYEKTSEMSVDEILDLAKLDRKEVAKMFRSTDTREQLRQETEFKRSYAKYTQKVNALKAQQKRAQKQRDWDRLRELRDEFKALMKERPKQNGKYTRGLVRASELPSPAPAGHLAREFGQSDREQIENSNKEPAVTQVLNLMNGFVSKYVSTNPDSPLMAGIESAKKPSDKVDSVFLTILNRYPTKQEKAIWLNDTSSDGRLLAQDLIWTLVNNSEFLFVQ